jgi:polysaccharide export outer membrane protein
MKYLSWALLPVLIAPAFPYARAQQAAGKPVLSAAPEPVTAPPVAAQPAGPIAVDPTYIIGADDSIQVDVWKEPNLTRSLPVRPDGMITLPLVGDIPAAGRTPTELASELTEKLKKFITEPTVTVSVLTVNSKRVYFFGEVGRPGPLSLTPGMTIMQAIDTAGGLTAFANKKHIYILRGPPGKQQKIFFDYTKAIKSGDNQGISLVPGDSIVVP